MKRFGIFFLLLSAASLWAQTRIIGRVVDADSNAVAAATVRLWGLTSQPTNKQGYFRFDISKATATAHALAPGRDLHIEVEKEGMVVLEPPDKKFRLPDNPETQAHFRVVMVKKGSPLLARSERMLEYILRQKIQAAVEAKEQEFARRDVLAEEAQRLGLTKETLLTAIAEYKDRLRTSADLNLRGLAALDDANEAKEFKLKQQKLDTAEASFRQAIRKAERAIRAGEEEKQRVPEYYHNLGLTLFTRARYDSAALFFAKADSAKPNVADRLNMWGQALLHLAVYDQAMQKFRRAYSIDSTAYGPNHSEVASRLNNMGAVLQEKGDYAGAKAKYEEALAIFEKSFGRSHPNVAAALNNLAGVLESQGEYVGAKAKYEKALAIDEKYFGRDHPNVATQLNNLAGVLRAQGDYAGAKAKYEEALAIDEKYFGPGHPNVATELNNIGFVLQSIDDYERALTKYEKALAICEEFFGREHPNVATVLNNIALALESKGDYDGALAKYDEALAIVEKAFGRSHPYVAATFNNIAGVLESKIDYDGALAKYKEALVISEKFGNQAMVGTLYNNLGSVYKLKKDWPQARQWLEKSLSHNRKVQGDSTAVLAYTYFHLAGVAQGEGQANRSREYAQKSLALAERHKLAELRGKAEALLRQKREKEKTEKMIEEGRKAKSIKLLKEVSQGPRTHSRSTPPHE